MEAGTEDQGCVISVCGLHEVEKDGRLYVQFQTLGVIYFSCSYLTQKNQKLHFYEYLKQKGDAFKKLA